MEKMSEQMPQEKGEQFDIENSPIKETYERMGAKTPSELSQKYAEEDTLLMSGKAWDHKNSGLAVNQVKVILEKADTAQMTKEEKEWRKEVLWSWNHHAVGCAISRYGDVGEAKKFAKKALENHPDGYYEKIGSLIDLLIDGDAQAAENWMMDVSDEEVRKTAKKLIKDFKEGKFSKEKE